MKLNTGNKFGGKTSGMLKEALEAAAKGEKVIVICASMREVFRLKEMTEELAAPIPVPTSIKLVSRFGGGVDLREPSWPHVRGMPDHTVFVDHSTWEAHSRDPRTP